MSELGSRRSLSREQVSRVVTELERAGLVERSPTPTTSAPRSRRSRSAGRARLRAAAPAYLSAIEDHYTRHLSQREIAVIATALGKVLKAEEGVR